MADPKGPAVQMLLKRLKGNSEEEGEKPGEPDSEEMELPTLKKKKKGQVRRG